jgi:nicotinate dehydrogenase subunit B
MSTSRAALESKGASRSSYHAASGVLLIVRDPPPAPPPAPGQPPYVAGNPAEGLEILLALWNDGSVTALNGHVDLGTGIRTALAQIVAEELDLPMDRVHMVLGNTGAVPNQGATIASATIQITAQPLRQAAAQARAWLLQRASEKLDIPVHDLAIRDGSVVALEAATEVAIGFGSLVGAAHVELMLDSAVNTKPTADYRTVGQSIPRVDIPAKVAGELVYVHDMRMPGMLHGRVVRPPYAGADHGDFIGNTLESVDEASIAHIPGIRAVVVIRDFVGVVAEREEHAEQAMEQLAVRWKPWPGMPDLSDTAQAIRTQTATRRLLVDEGDVDAGLAAAASPMPRTYVWPWQLHASIGPSCAVAEWLGDSASAGPTQLRVWAGSQNPHVLRADLARLMALPEPSVDVIRMEAAGCYGRNCADDVAADAALLARAASAPVRVQLSRAQEHQWEPKGAAQLMEVQGGLGADGHEITYDFQSSYPSNGAPTLALLLTRAIEPVAQAFQMGDRTARPPYAYDNLRVAVNDMPPLVRASWLRGVAALPSSFAHESYVDELATAAGVDPVEFRLRYLKDPRAVDLVRATAEKAGWRLRIGPQEEPKQTDGWLRGQGFAYARYMHSKWPGFGAAWTAWVADVEVHPSTGEVHVRRVVVGHDAGLVVNPAGVEHQVHGNVLQTTSRALKEQVAFTPQTALQPGVVQSREWGSYPILNFREVPVIDVLQMPRPDEEPLGAGESSSVPGTAAIANAIFDATGVRFRNPPFTPETVRAALNEALPPLPQGEGRGEGERRSSGGTVVPSSQASPTRGRSNANARWPKRRGVWATGLAMVFGGIGVIAALLGWRSAIAPVVLKANSATVYTAATIERGRLLAAAGDCAVCHTAPSGAANAGGRPMATPFGTIYSTNLTPDAETGIGSWSFSAFQRAMREGISRDGHHLYPVFPYTAFAKTSDADLTALYAYLVSQPAVRTETPAPQLITPFSLRPLMPGWNALFHTDARAYQPDAARSAEWNRGAYLVTGLGHCGACHTARNALGAEKGGTAFLAGAMVDGWEAPALTALSKAPLPWNAESLYQYLRTGVSVEHGTAGGPMAPVVHELQQLPDTDIRAMASYLTDFQQPASEQTSPRANPANTVVANAVLSTKAQSLVAEVAAQAPLPGTAQRMFDAACAACHHDGNGPRLLGANVPLALNSNLHAATPDNLLHAILAGVQQPATQAIGFMPSFADALDDAQIAMLAGYMRQRFAPGAAPWPDLAGASARVRASIASHLGSARARLP